MVIASCAAPFLLLTPAFYVFKPKWCEECAKYTGAFFGCSFLLCFLGEWFFEDKFPEVWPLRIYLYIWVLGSLGYCCVRSETSPPDYSFEKTHWFFIAMSAAVVMAAAAGMWVPDAAGMWGPDYREHGYQSLPLSDRRYFSDRCESAVLMFISSMIWFIGLENVMGILCDKVRKSQSHADQ